MRTQRLVTMRFPIDFADDAGNDVRSTPSASVVSAMKRHTPLPYLAGSLANVSAFERYGFGSFVISASISAALNARRVVVCTLSSDPKCIIRAVAVSSSGAS